MSKHPDRLPTQREAKDILCQTNQREPGDSVCPYESCVLLPDHAGAHLPYEQVEAIALGDDAYYDGLRDAASL